jgi:glutamate-1-semialdehyde 2,1-aminomutase
VEHRNSIEHMTRARAVLARGVGSALRAAQRRPLVVRSAAGARLVDIDGNSYVDHVLGFGPILLGHNPAEVVDAVRAQLDRGILYGAQHEAERELAERIIRLVPGAEMIALSSTGSEAAHAAIRFARAATGRRLVVKFEGHYHGWLDPLYANGPGTPPLSGPGPRPATNTLPALAPPADVLVTRWNDASELAAAFEAHPGEIAAVIMEPVPCNFGNFEARPGYLQAVRELCDDAGALLIFDEVITGFRLGLGGAQERYGVTPDLTVLAKAIAAGFPLSAVAGSRSAMHEVSDGAVLHAGTYNGSPVSVAAAVATLSVLERDADRIFPLLEARADQLAGGLSAAAAALDAPLVVNRVGSVLQLWWPERGRPVTDYSEAVACDRAVVASLAAGMVEHGIHALERGMWFVSAAHTPEDIQQTVDAASAVLETLVASAPVR